MIVAAGAVALNISYEGFLLTVLLIMMKSTVESRFLEPSVSRTSRYVEPNLVSLGFASLKLSNFTPNFSNPRFLETPDNSNQLLLPCDKLTLGNSNLWKFPNHLVRISITFTPLNKFSLPDKLFSRISKPQICHQSERYNDCFGLQDKSSLIQYFFWRCCCNTSINFVVPLKWRVYGTCMPSPSARFIIDQSFLVAKRQQVISNFT